MGLYCNEHEKQALSILWHCVPRIVLAAAPAPAFLQGLKISVYPTEEVATSLAWCIQLRGRRLHLYRVEGF